MKKIIVLISTLLLSVGIAGVAIAEYELDTTIKSYVHTGEKYPPVFFVTDVNDDSFKKKLEKYKAFELLDSESSGYPIAVRVLNGLRKDLSGGSVGGIASAILVGGSLGLIPAATTKTYIVQYDVYVQGDHISKFRYEMNYQELENIWTVDPNRKDLKPDEQIFLEQTLLNFLTELKKDQEVQKLFAEYREYF